MSIKSSEDEPEKININLMTLRKPTELKKVIDSVPKPNRAVPENGLPMWYKLGLECKLPVPHIPAGKIVFSRGKIGEDVFRKGLGAGPQPTFDLSDPHGHSVSTEYVPIHDPHLTHHFSRKPARNLMISLGNCTKDGRAICTLKEFNQYRKFLYNKFMDRIHMEIKKLDERARDDLVLRRVEADVARRKQVFIRRERAREHLEKVAQEHADEFAEKKRLAKEREKKVRARIKYLAEFNEKNRKERAQKAREKENQIKQRVHAAAELEIRRKITMIRLWRSNEKKRLNTLKLEQDLKQRMLEAEAENKWKARVESQHQKIINDALLLKIYMEDMKAAARRRAKRAEEYAYNTDLELQRIRMANWRKLHGSVATGNRDVLIRKMGAEFEKSKRGSKGINLNKAQRMASEAVSLSMSTPGDTLMMLGQARARMDMEIMLPSPPIKILDQLLENAIMIYARKRVNIMMQHVQHAAYYRAAQEFNHLPRSPASLKGGHKPVRWSTQNDTELPPKATNQRNSAIAFGEITHIQAKDSVDYDLKRTRDRPPTPVPSLTTLVEVTFSDNVENLPDPVSNASNLPERRKMIEMVNIAGRVMMRSLNKRITSAIDLVIKKITLPHIRHPMTWSEAVDGVSTAVVEGRVRPDCPELRQATMHMAYAVLQSIRQRSVENRKLQKGTRCTPKQEDFYKAKDD
ncbi:uncharacterized protein LOC121730075 [Aricia agestis]|uniref:uncharacterized protein LOC121730075 n=1 Tax=Aricia agestis TaxID=91739 RepID=UPI001C20378B|nr:uncharacterized protein LOC121730075 [Aricia agestis]